MSETTAQIIERVGLIPVLRARNAAQAHAVVKAMLAGGVTVVEVTMTVPGAVDLLEELKNEYGTKLLLGSGTVTTAAQAEATIDAGAEFVVSPSLHPAVITTTKANGKLSIPGALTPTEVITAWERRRGLRQDLSLLGHGRRKLPQIACSLHFRNSSSFPPAASRCKLPRAFSAPEPAPWA